jgi:1,4-dihydroxy-2-naphthoyl-CoA synthase
VRAAGPAARITLNRPEKRNALSLEVMEELIARCAGSARIRACGRSSLTLPARRSPQAMTWAR